MAPDLKFTRVPFEPGEAIPTEYTCDGDDVSPPLAWSGVPEGTASFAFVVDDPDAPGRTFVHWVCYNIPADCTGLPRDVNIEEYFADADPMPEEGGNDFGNIEYGGPCPPAGDTPHRYFFRLYALDTTLDLGSGASRQQLNDAMDGHVRAESELIGTYGRTS